jgi:hypothetical protein
MHRHFAAGRKPTMQAIQAIVDTYVRLRNEAALLALKQQRFKVLATCAPNDPMFARLRSQCLEDISEIDAGLERLRPPPIVVPAPPPSPPCTSPPPAKEVRDLPPFQPMIDPLPTVIEPLPAPATVDSPALPTPIDPLPFPAAAEPSPPILAAPSPVPAAADPPSINVQTEPPQPFAASHVAPSLLASTLLAASLSAKLPANGDKLEPELMRLQIALHERMTSQR